jgi:hypothetical protein
MKAAALLALLASLAMAPLSTAVATVSPMNCAAECCQTDPDCCETAACPCPPLACHPTGAGLIGIPATAPISVFEPRSSAAADLKNDSYVVRTSRPPVPPPRA